MKKQQKSTHILLSFLFLTIAAGLISKQASATTTTGTGCLDNKCVFIVDSTFSANTEYLVKTLNPSNQQIQSYTTKASADHALTIRLTDKYELRLLGQPSGLKIWIKRLDMTGMAISPTVFSTISSTTKWTDQRGHEILGLYLNPAAIFASPSYNVFFYDKNNALLRTVSSVTPRQTAFLTVDLNTLPDVMAAYNADGVYIRLQNQAGKMFDGRFFTAAGDFGTLDNFYRATQLQGTFAMVGQGLVNVQSELNYLLKPIVDVPYKQKFGTNGLEIPFADTLTITRFLGGYKIDAVKGMCNYNLPVLKDQCASPTRSSLDYVVSSGSGFAYQSDLLKARIDPYINAGYKPADIGLVMNNVPWDMASAGAPLPQSTCDTQIKDANGNILETLSRGTLGVWGQCNPPANYNTWRASLAQLATDLKNFYPAQTDNFNFIIGDESDGVSTYNATTSDFYSTYENAYTGIKSVLPNAKISAGDFTTACWNFRGGDDCVYDTQKFLIREAGQSKSPVTVPRSSNAFWDINATPTPSFVVDQTSASYDYVSQAGGVIIPEIHQSGFLNMPWGANNDTSSLSANWNFQMLMGMKQQLPLMNRIFNWGGVERVPYNATTTMSFLNGYGFLGVVLDNALTSQMYNLPVRSAQALEPEVEVMAVAFIEGNLPTIVISNSDVPKFDKIVNAAGVKVPVLKPISFRGAKRLTITLPSKLTDAFDATSWSYLRYSPHAVDNVFAQVKADLSRASLLDDNYASCSVCYASPMLMVKDSDPDPKINTNFAPAKALIYNNWPKYKATMSKNLKWTYIAQTDANGKFRLDENGVNHRFTQNGNKITITVGPNEMIVLKPR